MYIFIIKKKGSNLREFKPLGGESWLDVLDRSSQFLDELIIKYVKKDYSSSKHKLLRYNTISNEKSSKKPINKSSTINSGISRSNTISLVRSDSKITSKFNFKNFFPVSTEKKEYEYFDSDYNELFKKEEFVKKISKIYNGYSKDSAFKRVLIISHSGFIMELLNSIRLRKDIKPKFLNDSKPTSLYIFKIYCSNCGLMCYSKDNKCDLQYDVVLYNNIDHLRIVL